MNDQCILYTHSAWFLCFFFLCEFTTWRGRRCTVIWRVNADREAGRRKNATSSCRTKQEPLLPIWICHITRPGWLAVAMLLAHVTPLHPSSRYYASASVAVALRAEEKNYPILNHIHVNLRLFHWAISGLSAVCWRITEWMPCLRTPSEPLSSRGASSASGCQDSSACKDQFSKYVMFSY